MSDHLLSISEASKKLGVAAVTLRLWERQGKIQSLRTGGNQRRYSSAMLETFLQSKTKPQITEVVPPQETPIYKPILLTPLLSSLQKQVFAWVVFVMALALSGFGVYKNYSPGFGILGKNIAASTESSSGSVLAAETVNDDYRFVVNVPSLFNKDITAPNIIYGLTAGANVTITGGQNPTISAIVSDQTTDLKIFKTVKVGSTEISAGSKTDTLELVAGSNVTLSTSDKKITIAASSTDITTSGWTDDGTIVRLTTAGNLVSLGAATGAARLNLNVDDDTDLLTASKSGNLKFKLNSNGVITSGTWNGTVIANAYLANSAVTVTAGTGLSGGGSVSLGDSVTLTSTLGTSVDLTSEVTGVLPIANGGTNQSTYTTGDILYSSATNTLSKLAIGSTDQMMVVSSGGVPSWTSNPGAGGTGVFGYWQRAAGALAPANTTDDFLVGGTSTASAKFAVVSGSGNITSAGTLTLPNSNTLTGQAGNLQFSQGISVGGGTTYYVNTSGNANFNTLNAATTTLGGTTVTSLIDSGSASVSGGLILYGVTTVSTTGMQSLNLGDSSTGNIVTSHNISATGTLTGLTGLTVASGTVSLPAGQIDSTELVGTDIATVGTITTGTWNGTAIGAVYGGTGQTSWTTGDLLYASGTNALAKLGIGANNQVLAVSSGIPTWTATTSVGNLQRNSGALSPLNIGDDLLVGAISTASAKISLNATSGLLTTTLFKLTTSPASGYVLVSDAVGNGSWTNLATSGTAGPWTLSGSTLYPDETTNNVLIGSVTTTDDIGKLTVSGAKTGKALVVLNETGDQNILSASASGVTKFVLDRTGTITTGIWNGTKISEAYGGTNQSTYTTGDLLYSSATNTLSKLGIGSASQVLTVSGGIPGWVNSSTLADSTWQRNSGAISPLNITDDLLIGAISTASAKLSVISGSGNLTTAGTITLPNSNTLTGVSGYTQASAGISVGGGTTYYINNLGTANLNAVTVNSTLAVTGATTLTGALIANSTASVSGALSLFGTPTIASTAMQSLTLGGSTTGNIVLDSGTGIINMADLTASRAIFTDASSNLTVTGASADLLNSLSDETGTGVVVFGTSPAITTSLTTGSTTFALVNTTATTVNFAGAATALNLGAATGTTTIANAASVSGALTLYGTPTIATTALQTLTLGGTTTGNIQLAAGSATPAFVLTTAGQVGIGTTGPGYKLDVAGTVRSTTGLFLSGSTAGEPGGTGLHLPYVGSDPDTGPAVRWTDGTLANTLGLYVSSGLFFQGNTGNPDFSVRTVTGTGTIGTEVVHLGGGSASAVSWFNAGNVGIGTTSPLAKLDVNGTASVSGALSLYGTATIDSTAMKTLTLGGLTTGNIVLDSGTGIINMADLTASRAIFTDASSNLTVTGASADLLNSLSDETGTGLAVFGTSPAFTTSITTGSTTFALVNTTATTVNFAGAATTLSIGAATGTTTVNNGLTVSGAFTLGDNGDLGAIDTSDWNITATGDLSGIGTIAADGNITQSGATTFTTGTGTVTVAGAATVSASLAFGPQSTDVTTCNAANEGRVYYKGTTGTKRLYLCDGTTWQPISAGTLLGGPSYITLSPEFPGAVISADGSNNTGTFTSDREATGSGSLYNFNYYEFSTGQTSLQDYDVYVRWEVPENFSSWATSNAVTIDYATEDTSSANNKIDIQITKENDADTVTSTSNVSPTAGKWQSSILASSPISFTATQMTTAITWAAGDVAIIRIRLFSKDNYFSRLGAIKFDWQ